MTTTALNNVLTQLATIEAAIEGVVEAHAYLPESLFAFPSFVNYPSDGTSTAKASRQMLNLDTVICEVHCSRAILPEATAITVPFVELFRDAIWTDPTLGGTVTTVNEIRHEVKPLPYGAEMHLGIRFYLDYKIRRTVGSTTPG